MAGFNTIRSIAAMAMLAALLGASAHAGENSVEAASPKIAKRDTPPYVLLGGTALPQACARIYPEMAQQAAALQAGFTAHLDSAEAKEAWGRGIMLAPDATDEMRRKRQAHIDAHWQQMAAETREMFAPERITCLVSHMRLKRAQCQALVDSFGAHEDRKPTQAQWQEMEPAMDATIEPCMPLVTHWPGKNTPPR